MPLLLPPRQQWNRRLIMEMAVLVTLLLHALFCSLFRLREPGEKNAARPVPEAFVTALADGPAPDQEFADWGRLADPTLLTLPNPKLGFSTFLTTDLPRPYTPLQEQHLAPAAPALPPAPETVLGAAPAPLETGLRMHWPVRLPADDEETPPPAAPAATGMLWHFADGTPIPPPPEVNQEDALRVMAAHTAAASSRFEILLPPPPAAARLRLTDSSGSAVLDQFAYIRLTALLRSWEQQRLNRAPGFPAARFTPETGYAAVVDVEWRRPVPAAAAPP